MTKTNASGEALTWKVIDMNESTGEIEITRVGGKWTNDEKVRLYGGDGYANLVTILNTACENLYSKGDIKARSMTIEDVNKIQGYEPVIKTGHMYYPYGTDVSKIQEVILDNVKFIARACKEMNPVRPDGFGEVPKFYVTKETNNVQEHVVFGGGVVEEDSYGKYLTPTTNYPVYVKYTKYNYPVNSLLADILGGDDGNKGWMASRSVISAESFSQFHVAYSSSVDVNFISIVASVGYTNGLRPVVALPSTMFDIEASSNGVWELK